MVVNFLLWFQDKTSSYSFVSFWRIFYTKDCSFLFLAINQTTFDAVFCLWVVGAPAFWLNHHSWHTCCILTFCLKARKMTAKQRSWHLFTILSSFQNIQAFSGGKYFSCIVRLTVIWILKAFDLFSFSLFDYVQALINSQHQIRLVMKNFV